MLSKLHRLPRKPLKPQRWSLTSSTSPKTLSHSHIFYSHASDPKRYIPQLCIQQLDKIKSSMDLALCNVSPAISCDKIGCITLEESETAIVNAPELMQENNSIISKTEICSEGSEQCNIELCESNTATFIRTSQNHLSILREKISNHRYSQGIYLQRIDSLIAAGITLPFSEMMGILKDILNSSDCYFINKMNVFLHHDCLLRTSLSVKHKILWDIIMRSLTNLDDSLTCANPLVMPSYLAGKAILKYIFDIFIKDLKSQESSCSHLLDRVLLFESKFSWHTKYLDISFSLLEHLYSYSGYTSVSQCLDTLLCFAVLPLVTMKTELEREEVVMKIAMDMSQCIHRLSNSHKKQEFILSIPSEHLRLMVINIHLERYFTLEAPSGNIPRRNLPFSLSCFNVTHLKRTLLKPDGTRQDMGYFLTLLVLFLQSHLLVLSGVPLVSFFPKGLDNDFEEMKLCCHKELKEIHHSILVLSNRLSSDPVTSMDLTNPTNWHHLQLLITLTSSSE